MSNQTTGDRTAFPAGTAVSGIGTADSSGINGPFTECDALMRERDALVYHRQMLKRKRTELEQSLKKQRSERDVCPALFVFHSAEALLKATPSDRVCRLLGTHGIPHAAPMLRRLELDVPELTEAMVQYITEWETAGQLEYLAIRLRRVTPALKLFCSMPSLRFLDLNHTTITNEDLKGLQGCQNLVKMDLSYCRGVIDVSHISHMKVLEVVKLSGCHQLINVGALGSLPRLKELNLGLTAVTNEDVQLLSECHALVNINLNCCEALTNVNPLSSIATLEVIDLAACTSLIRVGELGKLPVLKVIDLLNTVITDEEIRQLSESHTLVRINLCSCRELTNVNPLSSIATLEVIGLSCCTSLTHVGALGRLPVLKHVNLCSTSIRDEEIRQLSESHTLVEVYFGSFRGLTNVNPLSSIATLEVMNLSACTSLTDLSALSRLPVLKEINLSFTRITVKEIRLLSECRTLVKVKLRSCRALTNVNPLSSITTLEVIDLSWCTSLIRVGALGRLPVLKEMDLSSTRITDMDVRLLSESRTLVKIDLHCCKRLTNVNPLSSIATMEVINLSRCTSLTHVGALGKLPVLREVYCGKTSITDDEVNCLTSLRRQLGLLFIDVIVDRDGNIF